MGVWCSKPNAHTVHNFIEIPDGDRRVIINNVSVERFSKGKKCFEITLRVSGYHGKLWYYLWYNPERIDQSLKNLSCFFDSFQIEDHDLKNYKKWIGNSGAVKVVSEVEPEKSIYNYKYSTKVSYCLTGEARDRLPEWREAPDEIYEEPCGLPF